MISVGSNSTERRPAAISQFDLGYPDESLVANTVKSVSENSEKFARYVGFLNLAKQTLHQPNQGDQEHNAAAPAHHLQPAFFASYQQDQRHSYQHHGG